MPNQLLKFLLHPVTLFSLLVMLFAVSFGIGPYSAMANIWTVTSGIFVLAILNLGSVVNSIGKFNNNKSAIDKLITTIDTQGHPDAIKSINDRVSVLENSDDAVIKNKASQMKKWLTDKNIHSLNDITNHFNNHVKRNSTLQILHGLDVAASLLCFTTGSILQTIVVSERANGAPIPDTSAPLHNFPASALTSAGYAVMNLSQIALVYVLALYYEETKLVKNALKEEESEWRELRRMSV